MAVATLQSRWSKVHPTCLPGLQPRSMWLETYELLMMASNGSSNDTSEVGGEIRVITVAVVCSLRDWA
jgi:hypothetical protein